MGWAARRRAEQRASVAAKVFPAERPRRVAPARVVARDAQAGLIRLHDLRTQQRELEEEIEAQVRALEVAGASWADLGRALGMGRQGTRQRYG